MAQITQYVSPAASGTSGATECGFDDALGAGSRVFRDLEVIPGPTGTPPGITLTAGLQTVVIRHREGAGSALTGAYRDFQTTLFNTAEGNNRGIESAFGTATTPDMFEFTFSPPVGHFGAHCIDLESVIADPGYVRAYDSSGTLIHEGPIHYPNNEDGTNPSSNELHFVGITAGTQQIAIVTVQVGSSAAQVAAGNTNAEHTNWLGMVDVFFGQAAAVPNRLTTTFANNNAGNVGGAIYFDLDCTAPPGLAINALDLNFQSTAGTSGSIDVYARSTGELWAGPLASGTVASAAGPGLPTHVVLSSALEFGSGCGYELAIVANGLQHAYTTGTSGFPLTYSNPRLTLTAGSASNTPFTEPFFTPRVPNVRFYYTIGGSCPELASVASDGEGCVVVASSIYEQLAPAAFDLAPGGLIFAITPVDDRVAVLFDSAATLLPFSATAAHELPLGNDDQVDVSTLAGFTLPIVVGSNGWVADGPGNSNGGQPSAAALLDNPSRAFYSWRNLNPAASGGGRVYYQESVIGPIARAVVTFDGVYTFGTSQPNTVQFVLDLVLLPSPSPPELLQVQILWSAIGASGGDILVGYSPGGASADPGQRNLSAITTAAQTAAHDLRLEITAAGRPVQGTASVPFVVTVNNVPTTAFAHLGIVGLSNPMIPLGILGLNGCTLYASLDVVIATSAMAPSLTWSPLTLPALPNSFAGFEFHVQSIVLGSTNNTALGIGALSSNGIACVVGSL